MKNASKNLRQAFATLFLFLGLLFQSTTGLSAPPTTDCSCLPPSVSITERTSNAVSFSFSWGTIEGAIGYRVWYFREEDSFTSQPISISETSIDFTNLPAGTYVFYFRTVCEEESSQAIILDDLLMG